QARPGNGGKNTKDRTGRARLLHPVFHFRQPLHHVVVQLEPTIEYATRSGREVQTLQKLPPLFAKQVAEAMQHALAMQDSVDAALYRHAHLGQRHAVANPLANLPYFWCGQIALGKRSAQVEPRQAIRIDAIAFGLVLGQYLQPWRMAQVGIQASFGEEISDPLPAERSLHGHGSAWWQLCQPRL